MKGIYCLIVSVFHNKKIQVGALGIIEFPVGTYIYVGSALNGLDARINRHIRINSGGAKVKSHWHIDYLLREDGVGIDEVWVRETEKREECDLVKAVSRVGLSIRGFGCSDCRCVSHLFKVENIEFLKQLGLTPWK